MDGAIFTPTPALPRRVRSAGVRLASGARSGGRLAEDPHDLGAAHRAGALGGLPAVLELHLGALELPLRAALHAVGLVRSHRALLPQGPGMFRGRSSGLSRHDLSPLDGA